MKTRWLDDPLNVQRLWRAFLQLLALLVLAEAFVALSPHFAIERLFGFHAWFGFLACAVMIGIAKLLGLVLKRGERYYDEAP
jgi:hypothetical protein